MTLVAGFAAAGIVKAFAPLLEQEPIPIDEVSFKLVLWGVLLSGFFVASCCTVGALLGKIAQKISQNEQKIQKKGTKMTTNEVYSYCSIGFCVFSLIFAGYAHQTNEDKANVLMCIIFFLITIPLTKAVFLIAELSGHSLFDEIKSNISWFDVVLFVGVVCLVSAVFLSIGALVGKLGKKFGWIYAQNPQDESKIQKD